MSMACTGSAVSRKHGAAGLPDDTIRIYVTAQKSPLKSLEFITLRVKDAVCDHFRTVAGRRPNVDTADPAVRIHLFLTAGEATLYLERIGAMASAALLRVAADA